MSDKTEWELVDEPANDAQRAHAGQHAYAWQSHDAEQSAQAQFTRAGMAQAILGPRWKFKVAGMAAVAAVVVVLMAMLTGILFLAVTGFALLSLGIAKLRRMLHGGRGASSSGYSGHEQSAHWKNLR